MSYQEIAERAWRDIPEPSPLPEGSWLLGAYAAKYQSNLEEDGSPKIAKSGNEMGPMVNVMLRAKEPMSDVSTEALEDLGVDYPVGQNIIRHTYFVADGWNDVRDFLKKLGVYDEDKSPIENLEDVKGGLPIIGFLGQRPFKTRTGEEKVDNSVKAFAAYEG